MCLYHSHVMCLLAALGPITDCNDRSPYQRAKKVVSDSPGLVDFAIGLVFLTCPIGKCFFGGEFKLQKDCNQSC